MITAPPRLARRIIGLLYIGCIGGCEADGSNPSPEQAVFEIRACRGSEARPTGETFRVAITSPTTIRQATSLVGGSGGPIVHGRVAPGDGGFNAPWSWHLEPATIQFVDAAVEVCDACPSFVEAHVAEFERVGAYCPWSTEVVRRLR
jgi:hypothetical protein